jgi:hypothetical protein
MGIHSYVLATAVPRMSMGANIEKHSLFPCSSVSLLHRRSGEKSTHYGVKTPQSRQSRWAPAPWAQKLGIEYPKGSGLAIMHPPVQLIRTDRREGILPPIRQKQSLITFPPKLPRPFMSYTFARTG